ncbi:MAG TPA: CDP-alcohol phosphatidyltransferase family protein [Candidatus Nanopelagicales bacterium]|nr:CDP-alcohol phosphatidyltransferase family protein [Candidatus Nanopelagicales bacterium]
MPDTPDPRVSAEGVAVPDDEVSDRILTIPNLLSFLRLLGVPLFLWLILVPKADGAAFVLLVLSGITDWLDGVIARATGATSRLGQLLDPLADRLYIVATLVGLALRAIIPWWLVAVIVARDLVLAVVLARLKRHGVTGLPVHYLGKAATFCLMWGFPILLLGTGATGVSFTFADVARDLGWAFAIWGTALYWWAGLLYLEQARRILRAPDPV